MSSRNTERIAELRAELGQTLELIPVDITLADVPFHLHTVKNLDDLLDALLEKGEDHPEVQDERIPYWAELWPSSIALSEYILQDPEIGPDSYALELGCGIGLCGVAAGKRGAKVIQTDYLPDALKMAEFIWRLNVEAAPDLRILDWRNPDPALAADVLIASDVAYEERAFEPLLGAFDKLLKPGGKILLSEPSRKIAENWPEEFPKRGFTVKRTIKPVRYQGLDYRVQIFELTR
ncbi:methyltransferase domain-containing protein [Pontibacter sp. G13]|uniref:class I SAM-dependent methyltransferase n=1 Tax=Pontibacter sp. G13 TaxID=3074898 RepID=UPI00288C38DD|nr:methyltransferase domain-containing protein [Pontibacter sp. G13]WNJ18692.1 methyltransferase domain-containing protein [Pontibacter sp. G13]